MAGEADEPFLSERCNIERWSGPITDDEFRTKFHEKKPVILVGLTDNSDFAARSTRPFLLRHVGVITLNFTRLDLRCSLCCFPKFPDKEIVLSTANTHSYDKFTSTLRAYITDLMRPQQLNASADSTLYHFGDNKFGDWANFFERYVLPPLLESELRGALSFGLGGSGSGVPFHTHGAVFAEVLHGKKVSPPNFCLPPAWYAVSHLSCLFHRTEVVSVPRVPDSHIQSQRDVAPLAPVSLPAAERG